LNPESFHERLRERLGDPRFDEVLEAVPGLACANNLALLNAAASCLERGESYVEVGSYRGTSVIAAQLGNEGEFVAIDDFSMGDGSREQLERNLDRFGGTATILEGDAFDVLRSGALQERRIGVYYYDGPHGYEEQLEGLRLAEPYLTDGALVIVDDTDWERVDRAVRDYVAAQPRAKELFRVEGKDRGRPEWWEGMVVLGWRSARKLRFHTVTGYAARRGLSAPGEARRS
jgi:predicted O-methyltransferase YrrM